MLQTHSLQCFSMVKTQNKLEKISNEKKTTTFVWCILAFYPTYFDAPELIICMQGFFDVLYSFLMSNRPNSIILIWFGLLFETLFWHFFWKFWTKWKLPTQKLDFGNHKNRSGKLNVWYFGYKGYNMASWMPRSPGNNMAMLKSK